MNGRQSAKRVSGRKCFEGDEGEGDDGESNERGKGRVVFKRLEF